MTKKYISIAIWPEDSGITDEYGRSESRDYHYTYGEAKNVCMMLERSGFGGDGKIFPISTMWVKVGE